jgi:hypothetical protein
MARSFTAVLALGLAAAPAAAQDEPQTVTLTEAEARFPEPFSALLGLRELSDGRVLISDRIQQTVAQLDFSSGTYEEIGRSGGGPGEYQMPGPLFALGDTTLLMDMGNRRLAPILPDGRIGSNSIPLRHPAGFPILPRGVDAEGRIYFDLAGMMMPGLEEGAMAGVAPILRWDRSTSAIDTMGYMNFPPMEPAGPGEARIEIGGRGPYDGQDAWSVTPAGAVGVARFAEYHIEWLSPEGASASGPVISYDPVKVTQDDKEAWADQMAARGVMIQVENGRRRTMRPPRPSTDNLNWPEYKPPFTGFSARAAADGSLWVERTRKSNQRNATYDVFDGRGNLVSRVVLPADRRLFGFGDGVLYAIYTDEDDLEWLERYRL